MNGPDLHVSIWVAFKSIIVLQKADYKKTVQGIILCTFCKHTQNKIGHCSWIYIAYVVKVETKCMKY